MKLRKKSIKYNLVTNYLMVKISKGTVVRQLTYDPKFEGSNRKTILKCFFFRLKRIIKRILD
jgi:hypothetical protein